MKLKILVSSLIFLFVQLSTVSSQCSTCSCCIRENGSDEISPCYFGPAYICEASGANWTILQACNSGFSGIGPFTVQWTGPSFLKLDATTIKVFLPGIYTATFTSTLSTCPPCTASIEVIDCSQCPSCGPCTDRGCMWYQDKDHDGFYGNSQNTYPLNFMDAEEGWTMIKPKHGGGDCDDDPARCGDNCYPKAEEKCDQYDNDCNGIVNDYTPSIPTVSARSNGPIRIPIVFHIIYNDVQDSLDRMFILGLIEELNKGFNQQNLDFQETLLPFQSLSKPSGFEFVLANSDPNDNQTDGIIYRKTDVLHFGHTLKDDYNNFDLNQEDMKFSCKGGDDAWPIDKYLNIWICDIHEDANIGGFAFLASNLENVALINLIDGVVLNLNSLLYATLIHEVGHYLGLNHTWGSSDGADNLNANCRDDDGILDTPKQLGSNVHYDCEHLLPVLEGPGAACPGECAPFGTMAQNFMDYGACRTFFTAGQVDSMINTLYGYRASLLNSPGLSPPIHACSAEIESVTGIAWCTDIPEVPITLKEVSNLDKNNVSYRWNTGEISNTINVTTPGAYIVTVSYSNCVAVSLPFIIGKSCSCSQPILLPVISEPFKATLFWTPVHCAENYSIEIKEIETDVTVVSNNAFKDTTITVNNLCSGKTYRWRVKAHCLDASMSSFTSWESFSTLNGPEFCDGIDNDCDGLIDLDDPDLDVTTLTWYPDFDDDGYGGRPSITQCDRPDYYKLFEELKAGIEDCEDRDSSIFPAHPEICDGIDNNCDGTKDEGLLLDLGNLRCNNCGLDDFICKNRSFEFEINKQYGVVYHWSAPENTWFVENHDRTLEGRGRNKVEVFFSKKYDPEALSVIAIADCNLSGLDARVIEPIPVPSAVSGPNRVCQNSVHTYSCLPMPNDIFYTYEWNVPPGAEIVSGQGRNSIDVRFNRRRSGRIQVSREEVDCGRSEFSEPLFISVNCRQ